MVARFNHGLSMYYEKMEIDSPRKGSDIYIFALSRADFWLLLPLAEEISRLNPGKTHLIISGLVEVEDFGSFSKDLKPHVVLKDFSVHRRTPLEILSALLVELSSQFEFKNDSKGILLGDRYETVGLAMALDLLNIPFAHISGGESTPNSSDDKYRKCISILAALHFPPLPEHSDALRELGIEDKSILEVGYLGWDNVQNPAPASSRYLDLTNEYKTILFTYHPNSKSLSKVESEVEILIAGLTKILEHDSKIYILITSSNHDLGGDLINNALVNWTLEHSSRSKFVSQLGADYYGVMSRCKIVAGNSSSGIVEATKAGVKVLNIGDRQTGRSDSSLVTHCKLDADEIYVQTLELLESPETIQNSDLFQEGKVLVREKIAIRLMQKTEKGEF